MAYDYDKASSEFKIFSGGKQISKTAQQTISRLTIEASTFMPRICEIEFTESPVSMGKYTYSLFSPGEDVAVFAYAQGNTLGDIIFKGVITGYELLTDEGNGVRSVFRCADLGSDMLSATKTMLYKEMTVSEVVTQIAKTYKLSPFLFGKITRTTIKHDTIVQLNETDWDFICRLARELGYICFVQVYTEFTISKVRLFWGPAPKAKSGPGTATRPKGFSVGDGRILSLRAMMSGIGYASTAKVAAWDHRQERGVLGSSSTSGKPAEAIEARRGPSKYRSSKSGSRTTLERMAATTAEANSMAKGFATRIASAAADIELIVRGHPAAKVGEAIYIDEGLFVEGNYVATSIIHEFGGDDGFITSIYCTGIEDRSLAGLQGEIPHRVSLDGVYPAIVNSTEDPKKQGRVNLTLPWLDPQYVTGWARVMQMGAGPGVGWQSIPAPKSEVLVAFENGQLETPYVIGGLHAKSKGKFPAAQLLKDGLPVKHAFTTKAGHQLIFDDGAETSGVTIQAKNGQSCSIVLSEKKGITITTKGDGGVVVNSSADVTVTAKKKAKVSGQEVTVESKGAIKVNGKGALDVTAKNINLNASSSAKLKGGSVTVEASGILKLKGSAVKIN